MMITSGKAFNTSRKPDEGLPENILTWMVISFRGKGLFWIILREQLGLHFTRNHSLSIFAINYKFSVASLEAILKFN